MKSTSTISLPIYTSNLIVPLELWFFHQIWSRGIILAEVVRLQTQPIVQIRVYDLSPTSLVYQYSFPVKPFYLESDHESIIVGLECTYRISLGETQNGSSLVLIRLDPLGSSLTSSYGEMVITLDKGLTSLLGIARMTLMVPKGGRDTTSLWILEPNYSPSLKVSAWTASTSLL